VLKRLRPTFCRPNSTRNSGNKHSTAGLSRALESAERGGGPTPNQALNALRFLKWASTSPTLQSGYLVASHSLGHRASLWRIDGEALSFSPGLDLAGRARAGLQMTRRIIAAEPAGVVFPVAEH
jgi:hypothetical protein